MAHLDADGVLWLDMSEFQGRKKRKRKRSDGSRSDGYRADTAIQSPRPKTPEQRLDNILAKLYR